MFLKQKRFQYLCLAVIVAFVFLGATCLLPENAASKTLFDRGRSMYPLTMQNAMWLCFFICLGELRYRYSFVSLNKKGLGKKYLLEEDGLFYDKEDVLAVRKAIHKKEDLLARLIDILTIRYQISGYCVGETHQMLNSQLELMQFKLDIDYSMIRYITWLIPTIGFIGTVVGISEALAAAGAAGENVKLSELTGVLAVAFDTTMVALVMSAILVYLMHLLQGMEERLMEQCGIYCLNNFINKLISKTKGGL